MWEYGDGGQISRTPGRAVSYKDFLSPSANSSGIMHHRAKDKDGRWPRDTKQGGIFQLRASSVRRHPPWSPSREYDLARGSAAPAQVPLLCRVRNWAQSWCEAAVFRQKLTPAKHRERKLWTDVVAQDDGPSANWSACSDFTNMHHGLATPKSLLL